MRITSIAEMVEYIKIKLGKPVVNVEVSDEQFMSIIDDSIQDFQRYTYGDGTFEEYVPFVLSAGVDSYDFSGTVQEISDIVDIKATGGTGSINELFTAQHSLLYNDWVNGNYPGGPGGSTGINGGNVGNLGGAMVMGGYYTAMTYLKEITNTFGKTYTPNYNPNSMMLRVVPTPDSTMSCLLRVYKKEYAKNLYNHPLVKKLCVARGMQEWGQNLDKYSMSLPGGGTINGSAIIARGEALEEKVMENLKLETEPPVFIVG